MEMADSAPVLKKVTFSNPLVLPLSPPTLPATPSIPSVPSEVPFPDPSSPSPSSISSSTTSTPCSSLSPTVSASSFLSPPLSSSPSPSPCLTPSSSPTSRLTTTTNIPATATASAASHEQHFSSLYHAALYPEPPSAAFLLAAVFHDTDMDELMRYQHSLQVSTLPHHRPPKLLIQALKHRLTHRLDKLSSQLNLPRNFTPSEIVEMTDAADTIVLLLNQSMQQEQHPPPHHNPSTA